MYIDKRIKVQHIFIFVSTFFVLVFLLGHEPSVGGFKFPQFLFNYENEFLKRGIVGEVFRLLGVRVTYDLVETISYIAFWLVTGISVIFVIHVFKLWNMESGAWLFALLALFHSATIQRLYGDLGRFDVFLILLAFFSFFCVDRFSFLFNSVQVPASCFLMLLIHEGALLISIPLVLGFWIFKSQKRSQTVYCFLLIPVFFLAALIISKNGLLEVVSAADYYKKMEEIYGEDLINNEAIEILNGRGIAENIEYTIKMGFTWERKIQHIIFLGVISPFMLLMVFFFFSELKRYFCWKKIIFFVFSISPLALYPLGHDHFRWWGLAITNLFVAITLLAFSDYEFKLRVTSYIYRHQALVMAIIMSSFLMGGVGVTSAFLRLSV